MKSFLTLAIPFLLTVVSSAAPTTNATGWVTLAWDASAGTNVIAAYRIYWGVESRTYTNVVSAGTTLTCSVSNLVRGATYWFAATAVDAFGLESDYSTEAVTTIPAPPPPPTAITIIQGH